MKLIMVDRPVEVSLPKTGDIEFVDLSTRSIASCLGCFGCWTRTPGACVLHDDAASIYRSIAASDTLIYVSRIKFGSYDVPMKTMLERAIPIQQAFIRLVDGETHHVQRRVVPKRALVIGYGDIEPEEQEVFRHLVGRNARNMNFSSHRVAFVPESELGQAIEREVQTWAA